MQANADNICTLILAGGQGRRMQNQDKGFVEWRGKTMLEHCLARISSDCILISANRNIKRYQTYGHPVIRDNLDGYQGPLAGLLAAMQASPRQYILLLPCDSPHAPTDLQSRLMRQMNTQQKQVAICHDGERLQPLFALINCDFSTQLDTFLSQGKRKAQQFFASLEPLICDFSDQPESFRNFNRAEDLL